MSVFNDCRDCANWKGDCGKHHIDVNGHINYTIPSESYMAEALGHHGSCFEPSSRYTVVRKAEKIEEIVGKYSAEELEEALQKLKPDN